VRTSHLVVCFLLGSQVSYAATPTLAQRITKANKALDRHKAAVLKQPFNKGLAIEGGGKVVFFGLGAGVKAGLVRESGAGIHQWRLFGSAAPGLIGLSAGVFLRGTVLRGVNARSRETVLPDHYLQAGGGVSLVPELLSAEASVGHSVMAGAGTTKGVSIGGMIGINALPAHAEVWFNNDLRPDDGTTFGKREGRELKWVARGKQATERATAALERGDAREAENQLQVANKLRGKLIPSMKRSLRDNRTLANAIKDTQPND
jgi:hypothetical protein